MFIIPWIAKLVGPRFAKPVFYGLIVALLIGAGFALAKCGKSDPAAEQAEQTTRSGEAIANAADAAVETIDNRAVTEADIDAATTNAIERINNAANPDAVRDAVRDSVCQRSSHRHDPACAVR